MDEIIVSLGLEVEAEFGRLKKDDCLTGSEILIPTRNHVLMRTMYLLPPEVHNGAYPIVPL